MRQQVTRPAQIRQGERDSSASMVKDCGKGSHGSCKQCIQRDATLDKPCDVAASALAQVDAQQERTVAR